MNRRDFLRTLSLLVGGVAAVSVAGGALARRGRPMTPTSVAGVNRRHRRRRRRRVHRHMRLYSLPYGCNNLIVRGGVKYHYCGGIWYRPVYQGTTVVYIVEDIDEGADTNVEFED